jgi:hypothetical protein
MSTADPALEGDRTPKDVVRSIIEKIGKSMKREGVRITTDRLIGRAICRGKAGNYSESLYLAAAVEYVDERTKDDPEGLDIDHRADEGREACLVPHRRRHRHYQQPRWATAHIEDIDRMYVAEPYDVDDDEVRIDLDGVGSGGASLHDTDENVNISVWFTREQARELGEDLVENAEAGAGQ